MEQDEVQEKDERNRKLGVRTLSHMFLGATDI